MKYVGGELELFRHAHAWKRYMGRVMRPHISGDVLEVGGGLGSTTPYLYNDQCSSYSILEPDPELAALLEESIAESLPGVRPTIQCGTTSDLAPDLRYDTIIYVDVLEHIEDDRLELETAGALLRPGGVLMVLSPAFECLRTPFDDAIGHFRRYTISSMAKTLPTNLKAMHSRYLDCAGAMLSFGNRLFLQASEPSKKQIVFWCRFILPISRILDPLFCRIWGRSVFLLAQKSPCSNEKLERCGQ